MARISEKNPRFRTKKQIATDVAFILDSPLTHGTKHAVLAEATWVWTEFHGKTKGCPYWSKLATLAQGASMEVKLIHEHAVPKGIVIETLLKLKDPTPEAVHDLCERLLIGVVVTKQEDNMLNKNFRKSMPPEFFDCNSPHFQNPWLRYQHENIELVCQNPDVVPPEQLAQLTQKLGS